ncbi:unnamed protein product [Acanthoscelides obtectus]|uniref:Uncharacterized protein n=1 Tax=Acanthoscelides obtectus TaxID=200917 RepID=A0A9P0PA05_ACAOB|nr:unnamed protein product [Acanthoscelides obtectus]CAK1657207.1 hypothetical protein AOBTE_LOCUS20206 [Acanthoscelides obtectus]
MQMSHLIPDDELVKAYFCEISYTTYLNCGSPKEAVALHAGYWCNLRERKVGKGNTTRSHLWLQSEDLVAMKASYILVFTMLIVEMDKYIEDTRNKEDHC